MKRLLTILLYICIPGSLLFSQDVKISSRFDSTRIFIGDHVKFNVIVEKPVGYILDIPLFKDSLVKDIEIISGPLADTVQLKDGRLKISYRYLVTAFDSGFYEVPPVYAELKTEQGIKRFYSDYSQLRVSRVKIAPPDTVNKIFDIVEPYKAPLTAGEVLPWMLAVVVAGFIVWYSLKLLRKYRSRSNEELPDIQAEPAHLIALRALENLKAEELWQKGEIKEYYTRLSEILREYLQNRFGVYSLELTTGETLDELRSTGFNDKASFGKLESVLKASDLVKFAKYIPGSGEHNLNFELSWDFVSITRQEQLPVIENPEKNESEGKEI